MACLPPAALLLCALAAAVSATEGRQATANTDDDAFFNNSDGFLPSLLKGLGGTIGRISQYNWSNLWNNQTANMIMRDDHEQSKCYDEIGCVNYTSAWYHSVYRPVNFFPLDRHLIPTRFWVHTRALPADNITITAGDPSSVTNAGFDAQRDTKFIIHGFLDTGTDDWVQDMSQRLLDYGDFNVIAVDWRFGALPMYQQALSNTQLVAMETAHLIKWLQGSYDLDVSRVHIIGHSLGAQTAGYIGARVPGLGRITGLDPAEPGFQYMAPEVRLDPTDAQFVDVIHSDARSFLSAGLGVLQPCGHVDFFPNGGKDQPGCNSYTHTLAAFLQGSVDDFESELFACRHIRAVRIFTDSIIENTACSFVGHECKNFDDFIKGMCGSCGKRGERCASMGYHADKYAYKDKTLVPFYLTTSDKPPYCLRHYRIIIDLADPELEQREVKGHLTLSMYGPRGTLERYRLPKTGSVSLKHGQTYRFIVQTAAPLGPVHRVQLSWQQERPPLLHVPCLIWCPDRSLLLSQVTLLDMDLPGSDEDFAQTFCLPDGAHVRVRPGEEKVTLYNRSSCGADQTPEESVAVLAFPSVQSTITPSRLFSMLPFSPLASNGRGQHLRLNERTVDGGRPRLHRLTSRPAERSRNWLWDVLNLTRNL